MRTHAFLSILAALAACPAFAADPDREAEARAALALAAAVSPRAAAKGRGAYDGPCVCGNGCPCNGTCGCGTTAGCSGDCWPGCETLTKAGGLDYADAYRRAVREGRPLCVWVGGMACPACEHDAADAVHVHVAAWQGDDSPRCVAARPDGAGGLDRVGTLTGAMGPGRLRGALESNGTNGTAAPGFLPAGSLAWSAPRAAFYAPPPTPFFGGGFDGGFGGGGGGCASCGSGGGRRR